MHSAIRLIVVPIGIIALVMTVAILAALLVACLDIKPRLTREQFADRLERHLLSWTEGKGDDDTLPWEISDGRLERLAWEIQEFDLRAQRDKDKLRAIIATLRRAEVPDAVPPTYFNLPQLVTLFPSP
jgi:GAF domain-containing protein